MLRTGRSQYVAPRHRLSATFKVKYNTPEQSNGGHGAGSPRPDELGRARGAAAALRAHLGVDVRRGAVLLWQPRRRARHRRRRRRLPGHVPRRARQRDGHGAAHRRFDPQGLLPHRREHPGPRREMHGGRHGAPRRPREARLRPLRQRQRLLRHVLRRQLLPRPLPRDDEEQLLRDPLRLGRGRGAPARRPRGPVRAQASTTSARTSTRPCPSTSTRRTWRPCTASSRARSRPTAR